MDRSPVRVVLVALLMLAVCAVANAQPQRTFVASTGLDTNPCSRTQPCRNFAAAVTAVASAGEVIVLDSAGYGPVNIQKPVSIVSPAGIYAGITAFAGDAISVNIASGIVALRGLTLTGLGGSNGIDVVNAPVLHVDSCVIASFAANGVTASATSTTEIYVGDSVLRENAYAFATTATVGTLYVSLEHCRFEHNPFTAVSVASGTVATLRDTVITGGNTGVDSGSGSVVFLKNCNLSNANYAVLSETGGSVAVSKTLVHFCQFGLAMSGGAIATYGNNEVSDTVNPFSGGTLSLTSTY